MSNGEIITSTCTKRECVNTKDQMEVKRWYISQTVEKTCHFAFFVASSYDGGSAELISGAITGCCDAKPIMVASD